MAKDKRIDEITVEGSYQGVKEGFVYLKTGFKIGNDPLNPDDQRHGFGYLGQEEIRERMKDVSPCTCSSCKEA